MAQVYLSQYARRAGIADSASHVIGGVSIPAPLDTYIQYNRNGKFGAEVHFRYIYPIHGFQHGNSTNALGDWSHAEGAATYTGFPNTYSSSILSGAVTLSAEYGNITSSFRTGDFIYLNDYYSDNTLGTTVAKINSTSWDNTSSYVVLDTNNIHATTSFVGSLGTYYIQNLLGNKTAGAYIAHAEGKDTYAMGIGAHSEGSGSYAIGKYSHTEGNNTVALGNYQTIVGQYNVFNISQSAFIIGDGYAEIINSGTFGNSPTSGSSSFYINSTYSPLNSLTGSIITIVSASSSVSETFIIDSVSNLGGGEYEVTVNRGITQDYYEDIDTFSITKITRHNLLFASQSWFQVSASNIFLQGLTQSIQQNVITYDPVNGQVYYTSSNALSAVSTPLDIYDDDVFVKSSPTRITFTGSGVSASEDGAGVDVYIPEGPNFATANLVFTGDRKHDTNRYSFFLYSDLVGGNETDPFDGFGVSGSFHYFNSSSNVLGTAAGSTNTYTYIEITSQSIDLSFNADPVVPSTYKFTNTTASFSSSLTVTKSVFFPGLTSASYPNVVVIDTASGKLYYTSSFGGGTTNLSLSGSNTQVVFYSGSTAISGSPNFTFNYATNYLYATGSIVLSGSTFIPGISNSIQTNVVTINPATGQLFYTASNSLTGVSIPLEIKDEGNPVYSNPTVLNFTGSGVSASANGTTVDIFIPGGGTPTPGGQNTQIQFNSGSTFSGSSNFTFNYTNNIVYLTGSSLTSGSITLTGSMFVSGAISASFGPNTVGFYGTASWAQSASNALFAQTASFITASNVYGPFGSSSINSASYASSSTSASYAQTASLAFTASFITGAGVFGPFGSNSVLSASYASGSTSASYAGTASVILNPYPINVTGSTLYSVDPQAYYPNPIPSNAVNSIFFGATAGYNSSVSSKLNNVIALGQGAGQNNNFGDNSYSHFIGASAGDSSPFASQSNFIGRQAGYFAYYAHNSNFIGVGAGQYQTNLDESDTLVPNSGSYSNYIGYGAGIGYSDTSVNRTRSPGRNNTIIGTSISLPNDTSNYVNLGGAFFISGTYFNNSPLTPSLGYSSNILTSSINTAKVGINLWNPSYSLHVSGTVAFPNLTNVSQINAVVIDTASGQLYYLPTSSFGGGSGTPTPPATPLNSIQFNSASVFGGSAAFTFISASSTATLTGSLITSGSTQTIGTASINGIALIGTSSAYAQYTTAKITTVSGINTIYSLQTASYDGAFFDYTLVSGTNARAGQIMSIWSGSEIRHTETTTTDIGSTSEFIFSVALTAGSASLQVTGSTGAIIKTIIKSI